MVASIGMEMPVKDITCRIPFDVVGVLDEEARATFGSRSAVIRRVLTEWAERRSESGPAPD